MRSAVVGYGVIGKHHARILREKGTLCAVCDIDFAALEEIEEAELYNDYKEMLDKAHPDVVHICTPHYLHAEMIIEALGRGINVLCEKPLCIKAEDIDRILEAEKNSKGILGVCHQNRYNPSNLYVKEYLEGKGVEGAVGQVSWHRDEKYYSAGEWRGKWDTEGGGVLINQALHTLDLMQWLCGMPETLSASVSNLTLDGVIEVEDTATVCAKGKVGFNFYASNGSPADMPVEITLKVDGKALKLMPKYIISDDGTTVFDEKSISAPKACYGGSHKALIDDFYDCVREGRRFSIDGAEGAKVVRIILAAYRSGGKTVDV